MYGRNEFNIYNYTNCSNDKIRQIRKKTEILNLKNINRSNKENYYTGTNDTKSILNSTTAFTESIYTLPNNTQDYSSTKYFKTLNTIQGNITKNYDKEFKTKQNDTEYNIKYDNEYKLKIKTKYDTECKTEFNKNCNTNFKKIKQLTDYVTKSNTKHDTEFKVKFENDFESLLNKTFEKKSETKKNKIIPKFYEYLKNKDKPLPLKQQISDLTKSFNSKSKQHYDYIDQHRIQNLNIMNLRYKDSASNNYLLSILPRFKKIYRYNKRAETHFTKSYQDLNNSIVESEHRDQFYTVGNANKLNVAKRINEYKSYLKHFDN